jgi:hypothetical protein
MVIPPGFEQGKKGAEGKHSNTTGTYREKPWWWTRMVVVKAG